MSEPVAMLVVLRTDQPDIRNRIATILAAARPIIEPPETQPCVWAKPLSEVTEEDKAALEALIGSENLDRVNL